MTEKPKTYSIVVHVRRVTFADAFVAVPVTNAITEKKEDGTFGVDSDALIANALRISNNQEVEWQVESSHIEPHPVQMPIPENRKVLDDYYHENV